MLITFFSASVGVGYPVNDTNAFSDDKMQEQNCAEMDYCIVS
jgi:hypothetical protein